MERWIDGLIVPSLDGPMFILIQFYTISCKISYKIVLNYWFVFFFFYFLQLKKDYDPTLYYYSLICPKLKSAIHCLTKSFPIYQNKSWIIQRRDDRSFDPSFHHIYYIEDCRISTYLLFLIKE